MNRLEKLKHEIRSFVDEHKKYNQTLFEHNTEVILNRAIFDIESYIVELRKEYNLNQRIDTTIASPNILANFNSTLPDNAFRPVDYQFNFLYYLAVNFTEQSDLYKLINGFVDQYKHEFTVADIVITQTSVTRCKTNIRFAINGLRDLGLVLNQNTDGRRSWSPSVLGLVALLNIRFLNDSNKANTYKVPDSLKTYGAYNHGFAMHSAYDPTLLKSLMQFRTDSTHLYTYLSAQSGNTLDDDEKYFLNSIMDDFIDFTQEGLIISENGIKKTREFDKKSEYFQRMLFSATEKNKQFIGKLFNHFKQLQADKE